MGIWLELRCCNQANPSAARVVCGQSCWSHNNEGIGEMAKDTQRDVNDTLRVISKRAKSLGWTKTVYGWVCPHCSSQPNHKIELGALYAHGLR